MTVAVFVAPYLLEATARFVAAAARLPGVHLAVVTHEPASALPTPLRERLAAHWRVDDAFDPAQLVGAVQALAGPLGGVDRLVGTLEQLQVPLAHARERLGIPGMDAATARNFRDKARMKDVLHAAGVPCAQYMLAHTREQALAFAAEVGFPIVAKPPAGAGARGTARFDDQDGLRAWLTVDPPSTERPVLLEEFLVGEEHSFDSVTIDGEVVWYSVSRYLPTPLEVLRNPWMQWVVLLPRDIEDPRFTGIRETGPAALQALGLRAGLTHLEWFRRPDGSVAVSEVAARPPGAQITSLLSYAHDHDFYGAWAELEIRNRFTPPRRQWAVGATYLRGQHPAGASGTFVGGMRGVEELQAELGHLVVEARLPQPGQRRSTSYEGDGYVIVRDRDTEVVVRALERLVTRLRVDLT